MNNQSGSKILLPALLWVCFQALITHLHKCRKCSYHTYKSIPGVECGRAPLQRVRYTNPARRRQHNELSYLISPVAKRCWGDTMVWHLRRLLYRFGNGPAQVQWRNQCMPLSKLSQKPTLWPRWWWWGRAQRSGRLGRENASDTAPKRGKQSEPEYGEGELMHAYQAWESLSVQEQGHHEAEH